MDGKAYHFVNREEFLELRNEGGFIETAEFASNFYGTSKATVRKVQDEGRRCILDIEAQVLKLSRSYLDFNFIVTFHVRVFVK